MEEQWIKQTLRKIEEIKGMSPRDRLDYAAACTKCATAIYNSIGGWMQWLTNPSLLNDFDEETLKQFFEFYKRFTLEFLQFDMNATNKRKPK